MKRIPALDGIRGIAIVMVLIWHYFSCQYNAAHKSALSNFLLRCLSLGWSGVDLFFVLSGFLIAGILLDNRKAPNYFKTFYIRRVCRIFPLYYLILGLYVLARHLPLYQQPQFDWLFNGMMPLGSYATFTQNIFMGHRGFFGGNWLGMTWSLAVEEQFYLVVPLLIYFLPRSAIFSVFAIAILTAPILRCATPTFNAFVGTPWRADSLFSGACLALLVRSPQFVDAVARNRPFVLALFCTLLLGTGVMSFHSSTFGQFDHCWLEGTYACFILISVVRFSSFLDQFLCYPVLRWFGRTSYGIYMFHQPVSGLVHGLLRGTPPGMETFSDAGVTAIALVITLILAAISYYAFEQPILKLGHRVRYSEYEEKSKEKETNT